MVVVVFDCVCFVLLVVWLVGSGLFVSVMLLDFVILC